MPSLAIPFPVVFLLSFSRNFIVFIAIYFLAGSIVVRAHVSHAEGLRFEPDSIP